jgi:hypothetical protein|tara:strand:+ start:847 stop:1071 length:225 start_codon:yes stop_codon:yes gene_type:complete
MVGTVDGRIEKKEQDMAEKKKDKSVFDDKTISNDYKSGGAYKAILNMFAEQLDDEKFAEHCRKFFKGEKNGKSK